MQKPDDDHQAFYEEVGRRIRDARKRRNPPLTQDGLAKLVGLTRTSITNVEQGRQKCLLHTLADIAIALQVEAVSLIPASPVQLADLDNALKNRPSSEKEWIMSAVKASQNLRNDNGT
jgi:DNA-binding XRE family transcriptional regulator